MVSVQCEFELKVYLVPTKEKQERDITELLEEVQEHLVLEHIGL